MFDLKLFNKKGTKKAVTLEDLFSEIYENQQLNKSGLKSVTDHLSELLIGGGDITSISYNLTDYFKISVANDEQLIKLTAVITKFMLAKNKNSSSEEPEGLTEEERVMLMNEVQTILK